MSNRPLRVGIIGADAQASWAGASHVPALAAQPSLVLAAVATRRDASAQAAAAAFGAERAYGDPLALIADDSIDVVTVAVKVPDHHALVMAALAANKAVYCEAPLGATLQETDAMAAAAAGRHTAIGLQGRHNPSVRRAIALIASGAIGHVLSAQVRATTFGFGPTTLSRYDYFNKRASGASFLTITVAHVLDIIEALLGGIVEVDARTRTVWPQIAVVDTGAASAREIPDHVDLIAATARDASVSVQVLAGVEHDPHFVIDVRGSAGSLRLSGHHPAGAQVGDLALAASVPFDRPDAPVADGVGPTAAAFWNGAAINVGEVYASLARDIAAGTFHTPGFAHAAHNRRLIAAVERAADTGMRQRVYA